MPFVQTTIRVPSIALKRADALVRKLSEQAENAARGEMSRSDVLRLALLMGLEALERKGSRAK